MAEHYRYIEIGDKPFVKSGFPDETLFFSTAFVPPDEDAAAGARTVSLANMSALQRAIAEPALELIVCHPTAFSPWHWRWLSRAVFNRRALGGHVPLVRAFGPQLLRGTTHAAIAIVDQDDLPVINRSNFFLLDRCTTYFKRELPVDRWRLFLKTGHVNLPTPRFRSIARYRNGLAKVRPLSMGLPLGRESLLPPASLTKAADVFFAGRVEASSWVREKGLPELLALRERGITVDIPEAPLPPDEFYRRCASAWLTWSPEGYGWECFRHYEALACGSVPVFNLPTIERHQPLRHGEHAVAYEPMPGELTMTVTAALADKARLQRIAEAGRAHVLAHHTPAALAAYIVNETLATARRTAS